MLITDYVSSLRRESTEPRGTEEPRSTRRGKVVREVQVVRVVHEEDYLDRGHVHGEQMRGRLTEEWALKNSEQQAMRRGGG